MSLEDTLKVLYGSYMYPARLPIKIFDLFFSKVNLNGPFFDPFAGSGSLALASYLKCFDSIVWDLNPMIHVFVDAGIKIIEGYSTKEITESISKAVNYGRSWLPNGVEYWWPQEVLDIIGRIWGFFRDNLAVFNPSNMGFEVYSDVWSLYSIAALYASRKLSYADDSVPKWYKSRYKVSKVTKLLSENSVEKLFWHYVNRKVKVLSRVQEKSPKLSCKPEIEVKAADAVTINDYPEKIAGVLTSPPYIQAQEYIRSFSWELKLLGVPETLITQLKKLEIPYRPPAKLSILSTSYDEILGEVEPRFKTLLESYFTNTLLVLEKAAQSIKKDGVMSIFVGEATLRGRPIPIVKIFKEHLANKLKLIEINNTDVDDEIKKRRLFKRRKNLNPNGIKTEHLIFLKKY